MSGLMAPHFLAVFFCIVTLKELLLLVKIFIWYVKVILMVV